MTVALEAESCRRLVAPSCRGRFGYVPSNTMDVLRAYRGRLGEAVVIMAGYDDIEIGDAVGQIMAETEVPGCQARHLAHLPVERALRPAERLPGPQPLLQPQPGPLPALHQPPEMHLADWNTYSSGHPEWFGRDGIHLTAAGAVALAGYIKGELDRYLVPAASAAASCPAPLATGHDRAADHRGRHHGTDDHGSTPPWPPRPCPTARPPPRRARPPRHQPDRLPGRGAPLMAGGSTLPAADRQTVGHEPAATRSARTGSSGQPIVTRRARRRRPHRARAPGPAGLGLGGPSRRSWTAGPRFRRSPRRIGPGRPLRRHAQDARSGHAAQSGRRAVQTVAPRSSRALVPSPCLAGRQGDVGQGLDLGRPAASGRAIGPATRADVRVHDGDIRLERERQHGPRRVRADARQPAEPEQRVAGTARRSSPVTTAAAARRRNARPL